MFVDSLPGARRREMLSSRPNPSIIPKMRSDRGVILNWMAKMILGLVVGGVILFDTGSIAFNFFGLDSDADTVANAIATEIAVGTVTPAEINALNNCVRNPSINPLCVALHEKAREEGAKVAKVHIDANGVLKVKLRRKATTLVVSRIGPIRDWATATAEGRATTKIQ